MYRCCCVCVIMNNRCCCRAVKLHFNRNSNSKVVAHKTNAEKKNWALQDINMKEPF